MGLRSFVKWLLGYKKTKDKKAPEKKDIKEIVKEQITLSNIEIKDDGKIEADVEFSDCKENSFQPKKQLKTTPIKKIKKILKKKSKMKLRSSTD